MVGNRSRMEPAFEIISYLGAKPLLFGMTENQAEQLIGPPSRISTNNLGEKNTSYESFGIRYSPHTGGLVEIGFSKSAKVSFLGIDVFQESTAFERILQEDTSPYESVGFIVLLDLGITLTGFHDDDEQQKAITVFERGRWDHLKSKFKKFR
jgi:hypothetical protein